MSPNIRVLPAYIWIRGVQKKKLLLSILTTLIDQKTKAETCRLTTATALHYLRTNSARVENLREYCKCKAKCAGILLWQILM
jgi:hypothetical protein